MAERRRVEVAGVDFGVIGLAIVLVAWLTVTAWNWNSARSHCVELLKGESTELAENPSPDDVRECAERLLD